MKRLLNMDVFLQCMGISVVSPICCLFFFFSWEWVVGFLAKEIVLPWKRIAVCQPACLWGWQASDCVAHSNILFIPFFICLRSRPPVTTNQPPRHHVGILGVLSEILEEAIFFFLYGGREWKASSFYHQQQVLSPFFGDFLKSSWPAFLDLVLMYYSVRKRMWLGK